MENKTELWDKLGRTDPAHTKTFKRAGGFSGTAIKPIWSYRRMTEEFGACGTGWGINEPSFQVVPGSEGEVLVYCTVSIWYGEGKPVFGVGGDKVVVKQQSGLRSDDEAFKKAYTDAVTNALKMIGVGADVHMGLFDDNKYVNSVANEIAQEQKPKAANKSASRPAYTLLETDMRRNKTTRDLAAWWKDGECREKRAALPEDWEKTLHESFVAYGFELKALEQKAAAEDGFPGIVTDREAQQHPLNA